MYCRDDINQEESAQKQALEKKEIELEMERSKKWAKMFRSWDQINPEKLRRRVYKGIPNQCRVDAWALLLNVQAPVQEVMGAKPLDPKKQKVLKDKISFYEERRKKYYVSIFCHRYLPGL